MKLEFTKEMFLRNEDPHYFDFDDGRANDLAEFCNARLREMVADAPRVWQFKIFPGAWMIGTMDDKYINQATLTHSARLVEIESLEDSKP